MPSTPITVKYYTKDKIDEILDKYEAYIQDLESYFNGDEVTKTIYDKVQDLVKWVKEH